MRQQALTPSELSARAAAGWLRAQPKNPRVLLLLSDTDVPAPWYRYRLNYFVYPIPIDVTNALPPDANKRYDLALAYGAARELLPNHWPRLSSTDLVTLASTNPIESAKGRPQSAPPERPSLANRLLRLPLGVASIALVIVLGMLLASRTASPAPFQAWWANLAVAHLVGSTALAWLASSVTIVTGKLHAWPIYTLLLLFSPGLRRAATWLLPPVGTPQPASKNGSASKADKRWVIVALLLICVGCISTIWVAWLMGIGWDGFAIWQLKAKAFYIDGGLDILRETSRYSYAHLDYPLLTPLLSWWTYSHIGTVSDRWAQANNFIFYLDLLALFAAFSSQHVSRRAALTGVGLIATLPVVVTHAVSGFADIPMAAFILAIGICLSMLFTTKQSSYAWLLAWLFAGVALTKNEGLLACFSAFATAAVYSWSLRRQQKTSRSKWLVWVTSLGVAVAPWILFKRAWGLSNDLLQPSHPIQFTVKLVAWRLGLTLHAFILQLANLGPWIPCWGLLIALLPVGLYLTLRRGIAPAKLMWLFAAFQFAGYVVIYLITPHSLQWHLASSSDRLLMHIVPLVLLAALIGCFSEKKDTVDLKDMIPG